MVSVCDDWELLILCLKESLCMFKLSVCRILCANLMWTSCWVVEGFLQKSRNERRRTGICKYSTSNKLKQKEVLDSYSWSNTGSEPYCTHFNAALIAAWHVTGVMPFKVSKPLSSRG
jgi:hypothetical protein